MHRRTSSREGLAIERGGEGTSLVLLGSLWLLASLLCSALLSDSWAALPSPLLCPLVRFMGWARAEQGWGIEEGRIEAHESLVSSAQQALSVCI